MSGDEVLQLEKLMNAAWARYRDGDKTSVDDIYDSLMPFCLRICAKSCGKYIDDSDEEASIARLAIIEAFDSYNPERGRFLLYLGRVIRNRIIDYKRVESKRAFIPLSFLNRESNNTSEIRDDSYIEDIVDDLARKQQLDEFRRIIESYHITFDDLVKSGPKQLKSRENANKIARLVAADKEMSSYLLKKKHLPIRLMEERFSVNRKVIDRYRKYIISNALIIIFDLSYLKPYVISSRGGEHDA